MADVKISALPAIATPTLADLLETVQGGVNKKLTAQQIRDLFFYSDEDWEEQIACGNIRRGYCFEDHFNSNLTSNWVVSQGSGATVLTTGFSGTGYSGVAGEARSQLSTSGGHWSARTPLGSAAGKLSIYGGGKTVMTWRVAVGALGSDVAKYHFGLGLDTLAADADQTNGIYFEIDPGQSANWRYCTANSSVRTKQSSSLAVTFDAYVRLRAVINANWTSVEFFVGNTSIGTITDNIPTSTLALMMGGYKRSLSNAKNVHIDFVKLWQLYTTPL